MICKSNKNPYYNGTSAFFYIFFEKDLHLNAVEEASELYTSNTESLGGLAFFSINSWPEDIRQLFHKSEIGDTDAFKFILFAFGQFGQMVECSFTN